jgi:hypothetical protein
MRVPKGETDMATIGKDILIDARTEHVAVGDHEDDTRPPVTPFHETLPCGVFR